MTNSLPISSGRPTQHRATRRGRDLCPMLLIYVSYDGTCHHSPSSHVWTCTQHAEWALRSLQWHVHRKNRTVRHTKRAPVHTGRWRRAHDDWRSHTMYDCTLSLIRGTRRTPLQRRQRWTRYKNQTSGQGWRHARSTTTHDPMEDSPHQPREQISLSLFLSLVEYKSHCNMLQGNITIDTILD
jgi:hypothetical protein